MFKFSEREFGTRGTFNPLSAVADELFECVWPFCGVLSVFDHFVGA